MDSELKHFLDELPTIRPDRNYWLIRSSAGANYDEFVRKGFIAVGWNEITVFDINQIHNDPKNEELFKKIKSKVRVDIDTSKLEDSKNPYAAYQSRSIRQIEKFIYDIKVGDIIIVPSEGSKRLSFGEVKNGVCYVESSSKLGDCPFLKRKEVDWIEKDVPRWKLPANLTQMIYSHQTINNVSSYADYINQTLFDFYYVGDKASLVLRVNQTKALSIFEMGAFYNDLSFFIKEFAEYEEIPINMDDITVRSNLQSPGVVVITGAIGIGLLFLGAFTVLAGGGSGIEFKSKIASFSLKVKDNDFLNKLSDFFDRKLERKMRYMEFQKQMKRLELSENKDIKKLVESVREQPINNSTNEAIDACKINHNDNKTNA